MVRRELVDRKLQLIAEDLHLLVQFKDESLATLKSDEIRLAADSIPTGGGGNANV